MGNTLLESSTIHTQYRSPYLAQCLKGYPENLYSFVKFKCVAHFVRRSNEKLPKVLDLGCASKEGRKYFDKFGIDCSYFGVDYEDTLEPDAVCDIRYIDRHAHTLPWTPQFILLLDVLEHLDGQELDILKTLEATAKLLDRHGTVIIAVPQMYRLDRFKFKHLHYPEHKIRLTRREWSALIEQHFKIKQMQGFGFLSVIPYLTMLYPWYTEQGWSGRIFRFLRGKVFEARFLKTIDFMLTKYLGRLPGLLGVTNGVLIVAHRKDI